jgi:hypothetical protein
MGSESKELLKKKDEDGGRHRKCTLLKPSYIE